MSRHSWMALTGAPRMAKCKQQNVCRSMCTPLVTVSPARACARCIQLRSVLGDRAPKKLARLRDDYLDPFARPVAAILPQARPSEHRG